MASAPRRSAKPQLADVDAVDADRARLGIVEAQQQVEDGGLAGARRPDDRHRLARRDAEVEAIERQRLGPRRIAEGDLLESARCPAPAGQAAWAARPRAMTGGSARSSARRSAAPDGALQVADGLADGAARARHQHGVEHEGREVAGADAAGDHVVAAHPQQEADGGEDDEDHQRGHDGAPADAPDGGREGPLGRLAEAPGRRGPPGRRPARCAPRRASRRLPTPCRRPAPAPRATARAPCGRTG